MLAHSTQVIVMDSEDYIFLFGFVCGSFLVIAASASYHYFNNEWPCEEIFLPEETVKQMKSEE